MAVAAVEIQLWHAMTGALGDRVADIAGKFNATQSEYKVVPVFKGNYDETMAAGIAAFRAGNAPHVLQVFEVGTSNHDGRQEGDHAGISDDGRLRGKV